MAKPKPNEVLVGKKQTMKYAVAIMTQIDNGVDTVTVKARGRLISKAVDSVELARNRLMKRKIDIKDVRIGTDTITNDDGSTVNISWIEIDVGRA